MATQTKTSILYRIGTNLEKEVPVTGLIENGSTIVLDGEVIPANYKAGDTDVTDLSIGCGVTEIGTAAFDSCVNLAGQLVIPDTVVTIKGSAFKACSSVTSLTMSQSVVEIWDRAFEGCQGITGSLVIPNTTTRIRSSAFKNCTGFTAALTLGQSLTTIDSEAFINCGFFGDLVIPNSVTSLGIEVFADCVGITGVTISENLETIPQGTFRGCLAITGNVTIPNSIYTIGAQAFQGIISGINNLVIGNSVVSIGNEAFQYTNINSIVFPNSLQSIGVRAFSNCLINSFISFGTSLNASQLTTISDEAFLDSGITGSINIPNNVTTIGNSAFSGNIYASGTIRIGESVLSIGNSAFAFTSGITRVESWALDAPTAGSLPFQGCGASVIHVDFSAIGYGFNYAGLDVVYDLGIPDPKVLITDTGLKKGYNLPDGIIPVDYRRNQIDINALEIGDGITQILSDAFNGCSNLESIVFSNSLQSISARAFNGTALAANNLFLPDSLSFISGTAFSNITGSGGFLTLPNNPLFTSIGAQTFDGSNFIGNLVIPNSVTSIQSFAFRQCSFDGTLTLSDQIQAISQRAFLSVQFTGILTIPASITSLGDQCFANTSFSEIHFLGATPPSVIGSGVFLTSGAYPDMHVPVGSAGSYAAAFPMFTTIIDDL